MGNDCVKIKLHREPASENSDMDEFKMALFDIHNPEDFLLLIWNFRMALNASGMLADNTNIQYLYTLLHVDTMRQFYTLWDQVGSVTMAHLGTYFPPVNVFFKQKNTIAAQIHVNFPPTP